MATLTLSSAFLQAEKKSTFNGSEWTPDGEAVGLKDLWGITKPGVYDTIDGDLGEVICVRFTDNQVGYRIRIPFKNGSHIDLKLSSRTDLTEGDKVKISSIKAQLLTKVGEDPILKYDGEKA